jgi:hypothetical protein
MVHDSAGGGGVGDSSMTSAACELLGVTLTL